MSSDRQMHTSSLKKQACLEWGAAQNVELLVVDNVTCRRV